MSFTSSKNNPKSFSSKVSCDMVLQSQKRDSHFRQILSLLKLEWRIHSGENKIIPTFVGRVIQLFRIETFQTVLTFLPTITYPITEFIPYVKQNTNQYIFQSWSMCILLLMWVQQRNIIKPPGLIQMNSRTSLYISGIFMNPCNFSNFSGFEGILCQPRICSVGGIRPV